MMIDESDWNELLAAMRNLDDTDRACDAAATLQRSATSDDVPRLRSLLSDPSPFVREAAAWPLSDLGIVDALPSMLEALQMGEDEGLDNDGLVAALIALAGSRPTQTLAMIEHILASYRSRIREHAAWLKQFCT